MKLVIDKRRKESDVNWELNCDGGFVMGVGGRGKEGVKGVKKGCTVIWPVNGRKGTANWRVEEDEWV